MAKSELLLWTSKEDTKWNEKDTATFRTGIQPSGQQSVNDAL